MNVAYFAYGSNMDPAEIVKRCPHRRYLGVARLPDHRLAFTRKSVRTNSGVADIIPEPGRTIWGVLYEISDDELAAIDRKEGYGWAYERVTNPVWLQQGKEKRIAIMYTVIASQRQQEHVLPSRKYMETIISAAKERELPPQYINQLEDVETLSETLPDRE
jgi:gamma-glutamylcyclotransferase (GGCT)/AIG2-like uncharacterized protein YtfP